MKKRGILCLALGVLACSNENRTPISGSSAQTQNQASAPESNVDSDDVAISDNDQKLKKVLSTSSESSDPNLQAVQCDQYGVCAYEEDMTQAPARSGVAFPLKFPERDKEFVNQYGGFLLPESLKDSAAFSESGLLTELSPMKRGEAGSLLNVNWYGSAANKLFSHCIMPIRQDENEMQSFSENDDSLRFPGMMGVYGFDATGHWIFAKRLLLNPEGSGSTSGSTAMSGWYRVEVVSEALKVQGRTIIELPRNQHGMRFSSWLVAAEPYSLSASVMLFPEDDGASARRPEPIELQITTSWGVPSTQQSPITKDARRVLSYSQVWECVQGAPCPKSVDDQPLYWFEETLAKGLGRAWKMSDKGSNLSWFGTKWEISKRPEGGCSI